MNLLDLFYISINNLRRRRLRSWLTTIGIIIGISSVIALISIGWGMQKAVEESFAKMGKDKIMVFPGGSSMATSFAGRPFTVKDAEKIEKLPGVRYAVPMAIISLPITYHGEIYLATVIGIPADASNKIGTMGYELEEGRLFKSSEKDKPVCILGYRIAKEAFSSEIKPGDKIYLDKIPCKVIGVWEPIGTKTDDYSVTVPLEVLSKNFGISDIQTIMVSATDVDLAVDEIKKFLKKERGAEDFSVMTTEQILNQAKQVLGIISFILIAIASISLIVSAVGIMNTMYMAVTERIREIGLLKAIGAKNRDIMLLFLIEAGLIGLIGGIIGTIVGISLALLIEKIALSFGYTLFKAVINVPAILGVVGFSFLVGVISGVAPAISAAKLDPVEALRSE